MPACPIVLCRSGRSGRRPSSGPGARCGNRAGSRHEHGQPADADPDPHRRGAAAASTRWPGSSASEPGVNEVIVAPGERRHRRASRGCAARTSTRSTGPRSWRSPRRARPSWSSSGRRRRWRPASPTRSSRPGSRSSARRAAAARIESSKAFCHEVAAAAGVRMARGGRVRAMPIAAVAFARTLDADGARRRRQGRRAGGRQGRDGLRRPRRGGRRRSPACCDAPGARVVVEERLDGREASLIALCDGREALALPLARDHKRLGDGDAGPNTGGMGAYSPLADLPDDAIADDLVERVPPADPRRAGPARDPVPWRALRRA